LRSKSQGAAASPAASGTPSPQQKEDMEEFRAEMRQIISDLSQQLLSSVQTSIQDMQRQQGQQRQLSQQHEEPTLQQEPPIHDPPFEDSPGPELNWTSILDDLPTAPPITEASWPKVYKLAKEL
jgi:hypothetical protein